MITLLGALLGFFSSAFPDLIKLYRDRQDKAHELAILQLQMQQQSQGHQERLEEIGATADIAEASALYQTYTTHIAWVDALNGTVRPVLAYAFFLVYAYVKYLKYTVMPENALIWQVEAIWGDEDMAIFASIVSFYFGSRALSRARQGK